MTIQEAKTKKSDLILRSREILKNAKLLKRSMTTEEQEEFDANLQEIENLKEQIDVMQEEIQNEEKTAEDVQETPSDEKPVEEEAAAEDPVEEETKEDEEETKETSEDQESADEKQEEETSEVQEQEEQIPDNVEENTEEDSENKQNQNKRNLHNIMKNSTYVSSQIRSALQDGTKEVTLPAYTRMVQVTGSNGIHDDAIPTQVEGLLTGLYEDSLYQKAGFRLYQDLPMGDCRLPVMGKGTAGFAGEVASAVTSTPSFSSVLLTPKRITAVLPYSLEMIMQDCIGIEEALRRDIYDALIAALNEAIFGTQAATTTKFAGMFYNVDEEDISSYGDLCDVEATVADSCARGKKTYLLNNHAKAKLRQMIKGTNATGMVYENGTVDGTEATESSYIPTDWFAYGDMSNCIVAQFGDIRINFDENSLAHEGVVRIIINGYFDFKKVRADEDVIVYGKVKDMATIDSSNG